MVLYEGMASEYKSSNLAQMFLYCTMFQLGQRPAIIAYYMLVAFLSFYQSNIYVKKNRK